MRSAAVALLVFGLVFGAALLGAALQRRLPDKLRDSQTKETVQLIMGLVATITALVLSLLILSSHAFFETQQEEVQKLARDVILLDEAFARYGPEAAGLRAGLREDVLAAARRMSPSEGVGSANVAAPAADKPGLFAQVMALDPKTPAQHFAQSKAIDLLTQLGAERLLIHEQASSSVPVSLIAVMVLWLMFLFVGFGFFARLNVVVHIALSLGAFSVACAIYLILDMSHPYRGLVHVSRVPIETALETIGR